MKTAIYAVVALILAASILINFQMLGKQKQQNQEIEKAEKQFITLSASYRDLVVEFQKLSKQRTYSISLAPNINSKLASTFGSMKNVTIQYFFTMDGNKMELQPDSVYQLNRITE
jgi:flagellar basal body-associated protein FliL